MSERQQLENAIVVLEGQRRVLGDAAVDAGVDRAFDAQCACKQDAGDTPRRG